MQIENLLNLLGSTPRNDEEERRIKELEYYVNIRGDGVTDDTAAIQSVLDGGEVLRKTR